MSIQRFVTIRLLFFLSKRDIYPCIFTYYLRKQVIQNSDFNGRISREILFSSFNEEKSFFCNLKSYSNFTSKEILEYETRLFC